MPKLSQNVARVNELFVGLKLLIVCSPKLTGLNSLDFQDDPKTGVTFFGIDEKVSPHFFAGEVKLFVELDHEVHSRIVIPHIRI